MSQIYTLETDKQAHHFSCAHMATFADGSIERLHGHNYQLRTRLSGELDCAGMVLDVIVLKRLIRQICDELDEYVLIPLRNPLIMVEKQEGQVNLKYQKPVKEILNLADADIPPSVKINESGTYMVFLFRERYKTLADLAEKELRLAGLRINPTVNKLPAGWFLKNLSVYPGHFLTDFNRITADGNTPFNIIKRFVPRILKDDHITLYRLTKTRYFYKRNAEAELGGWNTDPIRRPNTVNKFIGDQEITNQERIFHGSCRNTERVDHQRPDD